MAEDIKGRLFALIEGAQSIAITTHVSPDGDGFVAAIALQEFLRLRGHDSTIVTDGGDLSQYEFLMQKSRVEEYHHGMAYDLVMVLDCNSHDRLGKRNELIRKAKHSFVLDHHVVEHEPIRADIKIIDSSFVSTGAQVYRLFEEEILALDKKDRKFIADCVYVTILNDTSNFSNANTNAQVFELCRDLAEQGVQAHLMNAAFLQNHSAQEMLYLGHSLATIRLMEEGKVLFLHSDLALAQSLEYDPDASLSVTRYVQGIPNLVAIAYFRETEPDVWKVSLRSLKLDVQRIAALHGGGGHRRASGLSLNGSLEDVQETIRGELVSAMSER